jgi:acetyltransferase-like isoleucine patch superfamily enzyme
MGAPYISVGNRTLVLSHSSITCLDRVHNQTFSPHLRIGNDVYIGRYCFISCTGEIAIEDGCVLSEHVYIADHAHGLDPEGEPIMYQAVVTKGPVHLGKRCFVGYRAVIMNGVSLGDHCVVGANAVVTRSFPALSMIAGVPARLIKQYSTSERKWMPVSAA